MKQSLSTPAGLAYAIPRHYVVKRKLPGQKKKGEFHEIETTFYVHDYETERNLFIARLNGFCGELLYHNGSIIANVGGLHTTAYQLPEEKTLAESHHGARILLIEGKLYKFSKKEGLVEVKTGKKRVAPKNIPPSLDKIVAACEHNGEIVALATSETPEVKDRNGNPWMTLDYYQVFQEHVERDGQMVEGEEKLQRCEQYSYIGQGIPRAFSGYDPGILLSAGTYLISISDVRANVPTLTRGSSDFPVLCPFPEPQWIKTIAYDKERNVLLTQGIGPEGTYNNLFMTDISPLPRQSKESYENLLNKKRNIQLLSRLKCDITPSEYEPYTPIVTPRLPTRRIIAPFFCDQKCSALLALNSEETRILREKVYERNKNR